MVAINQTRQGDTTARLISNKPVRYLLVTVGSISVVLGTLGIFLPVLPTTPFLLLAAACFIRSSERFYNWLTSHPVLSKYILAYLDGRGIPRKGKFYTILTMWITMAISVYFVAIWQVAILLLLIAIAVSTYIFRLPEPDL